MKFKYLCVFPLAITLSACTTSSGIIPDGTDSYRLTHTGDTGFTNSNTLRKNAYKEASVYCSEREMVVETVNIDSKQARPLGGWPEASLLFKCVKRKDNLK
jgi:hypothetical protein